MLEDDEIWQDTFDVMFPQKRMNAGDAEVEALLNLIAMESGTVLDLACGPGRHAIPLAKRGFKVTAVDQSEYLIQKAKEWASEDQQDIEFLHMDMRRFVRTESFSVCICLFSSFIFSDRIDELTVIKNVHTSLVPDGVFVLDILGKEVLAKIFAAKGHAESPDGTTLDTERTIINDWTQIKNKWTVTRQGKTTVYQFEHNLHSGRELQELLTKAGFMNVVLYGGFDRRPYDDKAERLIAVARP